MPSRRTIIAGLTGGAVTTGLFTLTQIDLWRYFDFTDPVSLLVENWGDDPHTVTVTIMANDSDSTEPIFEDTYDIDNPTDGTAVTRLEEETVVEDVSRYHVVGKLDDGTTDEYTLEPLDRPVWGTKMPGLIVSIDGETGHLWVGGGGGNP